MDVGELAERARVGSDLRDHIPGSKTLLLGASLSAEGRGKFTGCGAELSGCQCWGTLPIPIDGCGHPGRVPTHSP